MADEGKVQKELPASLSAKFKDSFAYLTIKDRMPVILTKVVDSVHRKKNDIDADAGEEVFEDLKVITGGLSKLRYEIQTDKPVVPLTDGRADVKKWNEILDKLKSDNDGEDIKWFSAAWLYLECYMYRRIQEAVELSKVMKKMDVFEEPKRNAFHSSTLAIQTLLSYLMTVDDNVNTDENTCFKTFQQLLQVALWGNKCDLSISAGMDNSQTGCILEQLSSLLPNILIDHTADVWRHLLSARKNKGGNLRVDIVLDNAGFELITDLCLAEYLLSAGIATTVHFHGKAMPWFVSDVTSEDFDWTLKSLSATNNLAMSKYGNKWQERIRDGTWVLHFNDFWTLPLDFAEMESSDPGLYKELSKADLVVFKGDLNYRKLVGDLQWNTEDEFERSLRGFHPAPLVTLRALKSDVVVGLSKGQGQETEVKDASWMINGNWSVICLCDKTAQL